ncbi:MAG: LysR family transcriptional regulator [Paenibacillaceae bacterium]|uniref:LysR family transcriptional regulator n=1 Tax=Paenibacillus cymbidii TaxID=1639034 RepID=UPI001081959F|nr:LysR family transcriptional regulator [Paenibacillus cymbidii]MBO9609843.1 LysR family transcriptional regulator [Paenibacillaceae bacterium]
MQHLDIFTVVVEQVSLSRASQLLNLSQPALSRKIAALEDSLGVKLFARIGKRLELTPAGHLCYEYAIRMNGLERDMLRALNKFKTEKAPASLTIGASLTTLQLTLPELIALYTADNPDTDIKAVTGKTHEIVSMLRDKKIDIGVVASLVNEPGLQCVPLFDDHLSLLLPAGHPIAERQLLTMRDLDGLPMILFSKGTWYRILTDELFHRYSVYPDVKMEIDSFEAIIRLVSTCKTATLLPMSYMRRFLHDKELLIRSIAELEKTERTTSLIFQYDALHQPSLHNFIWKAKEHFAEG